MFKISSFNGLVLMVAILCMRMQFLIFIIFFSHSFLIPILIRFYEIKWPNIQSIPSNQVKSCPLLKTLHQKIIFFRNSFHKTPFLVPKTGIFNFSWSFSKSNILLSLAFSAYKNFYLNLNLLIKIINLFTPLKAMVV